MKSLFVTQQFNPEFRGHDAQGEWSWPHTYLVTKVINAVGPAIHESLKQGDVEAFCDDEDWKVTIT